MNPASSGNVAGTSEMPLSFEDWEKQKNNIIQFYVHKGHTLGELLKYMLEEHRFKATRRQYISKLGLWGVRKNLKPHEKDLLVDKIVAAKLQQKKVTSVKLNGRTVELNLLLRHSRSRMRERRGFLTQVTTGGYGEEATSNQTSLYLQTSLDTGDTLQDGYVYPEIADETFSAGERINPGISEGDRDSTEKSGLAVFFDVDIFGGQIEVVCANESSQQSSVQELDQESGGCDGPETTLNHHPADAFLPLNNQSPRNLETTFNRILAPRHMVLGGQTYQLERVLHAAKSYVIGRINSRPEFHSQTTSSAGQDSEMYCAPMEAHDQSHSMDIFWKDTKNALYMMKKGSPDLAFTFLSRACQDISTMVNLQTNLDTLLNIFATLSPINVRLCPALRDQILKYLAGIFEVRFGTEHPLAVICHQVCDQQTEAEMPTSERALRFLLDLLEESLGGDHDETLSFRRELIRLLRRSGNMHESRTLCLMQIERCENAKGPNSPLTRRAMSELVYLLTQQGDHMQAIMSCEEILRRSRCQEEVFPDECAVYTLEDVAELYSSQGEHERSLLALEEALVSALRLWGGGASSTECILEKVRLARGL